MSGLKEKIINTKKEDFPNLGHNVEEKQALVNSKDRPCYSKFRPK